jgi:S1-C subfamily serine protease
VARHLRRAVGLPDREGVLVRGVEPESPADAAGIREGDLIVAAAGVPITNPDELHAALDKAGAGKKTAAVKLDLGIVRGAEELTVKVDLAAGPAKPAD